MYEKYLDKFMPSKDMRKYLKNENINVLNIAEIIYGSPCPVYEKLFALIECRESYTNGADEYTINCIDSMISCIEKAIQLKNEEGIFSLEMCIYDGFRYETENSFESLFCRYDEAISFIYDTYNDIASRNLVWFEITKWRKEDGKLYEDCTYYYVQKELRYINASLSAETFTEKMIGGADLNLPVPFKAGDIVEIDGCNFTPKFHALILDVGDNSDCCCLQGLARDGSFLWNSGAIKHGMIGAHYIMQPSMLYTIEKYNGRLRDDEEILSSISNFLKENSENIREFVDKVACGGPFKDKELLALIN